MTTRLLENPVAVDIETTGFKWSDRMLCISLARWTTDEIGENQIETLFLNTGYYQQANLFGALPDADMADREIMPLTIPETRAAFHAFIEGATCLVFHQGSFDLPYILRSSILTEKELSKLTIFDTLTMARMTGKHNRVALDQLVKEFGIKVNPHWFETKKKRKSLESAPYVELEQYARLDADYTLRIASDPLISLALEQYPPDKTPLIKEESEWIKLVSMLRVNGLQINAPNIRTIVAGKKKELAETMALLLPLGITGPNHRKGILKWVGVLEQADELTKTEKGNPCLDKQSLLGLTGERAARTVEAILKARGLEKQLSTWLEAPIKQACEAGRIHPSFKVSGTITGRLSCNAPNAQAFPKAMTTAMLQARPGFKLVSLDYSQAELRVAASYAKEQSLANEFAKPGADPHMATAKLIWGDDAGKSERQLAKSANFLSIYGGGSKALVEFVNSKAKDKKGLLEMDRAKRILSDHRKALPAMATIREQCENVWLSRGYLLVLGGKRVWMSDRDAMRSYKALNALIQPSVAELIKKAMLAIWKEPSLSDVLLVSQVHDSLYAEVPDDERYGIRIKKLRSLMVEAYPQELINRTNPPIAMKVDVKVLWEKKDVGHMSKHLDTKESTK